MTQYLEFIFYAIGISAFLWLVLEKYQVRDAYQYYKPKRWWDFCDLCVTTWLTTLVTCALKQYFLPDMDWRALAILIVVAIPYVRKLAK